MPASALIPIERIGQKILLIRGQKVMLDSDLAELYGVPTKRLNEQVRRNAARFPKDFMFQLSKNEAHIILKSQFVTSSSNFGGRSKMECFSEDVIIGHKTDETRYSSRSQIATLKRGQNIKYRQYAFTEQGVAMLSSVLHSSRAIQVNIAIMRAFVQLRQWLASHADLARKLAEMEQKYDKQFRTIFEVMQALTAEPEVPEKKGTIGFKLD